MEYTLDWYYKKTIGYPQRHRVWLIPQQAPLRSKVIATFKPSEMFHLSNNRLADQIHGISDIESLDKTLLAELESFDDVTKVMHRQAKPFIIFKLKQQMLGIKFFI